MSFPRATVISDFAPLLRRVVFVGDPAGSKRNGTLDHFG
jgi:hypothetical protein